MLLIKIVVLNADLRCIHFKRLHELLYRLVLKSNVLIIDGLTMGSYKIIGSKNNNL